MHTPTWYDLRESYNAALSSNILACEAPYNQTLSDFLVTPEYDYLTYDYNLTTPWKFNVSAGTTFAGAVAVGAEYEYQVAPMMASVSPWFTWKLMCSRQFSAAPG